ncbi:GMC oxidoreductase-domain-containing protein [Mycena polygramma]|nr:GMC oxidoreductase-domain-containing protein [Mycena polygramma]
MLAPALIISLFSGVALCKLYEDVADLPGLQYDFVIVGGGTAGNVVASRLTENPNVSVLVLEAGESNEGVIDSEVPFLTNGILFPDNPYSWNYTTTPQTGLNGRVVPFSPPLPTRFHKLDGMAYTRGAAADFDRYAQLTGDPGWSWNEIFPYFLKNEKWTPPADQHNTQGQFNSTLHGRGGPISVSLTGFAWPELERRVINTTKELLDDFPFNVDTNSGQPLGIGWLQSTIGHGMRSSSATGYLEPAIMHRPNLYVLLHAQVAKLVNVTQRGGSPAFGGVQFRYGTSLFVAQASREIIISAGTIGTPHILLNSGIGDPSTLKALGIPTVVDLPSVGKNASDHTYFQMTWAVNSNQTTESITQNATRFNEAFAEWNASHTGPFVDPSPGTHVGWLRLSANSSAFDVHSDPSPGPDAPHLEILFMVRRPVSVLLSSLITLFPSSQRAWVRPATLSALPWGWSALLGPPLSQGRSRAWIGISGLARIYTCLCHTP